MTEEGLVYAFANGLRITPSQVRLDGKFWRIKHIKSVWIDRASGGIGIPFYGLLTVVLIMMFFAGSFSLGKMFILGLALWSGYGMWASWDGLHISQVRMKIGATPIIIFQSRDEREAKRVKNILEDAIAELDKA
ncbi:DUF6232 family protein [Sagittula sp. SSi028]|uniref:DUF6232 family protein n=1 Tax=Sagittula sp. SSi028 TaxID=3400636 RepID=UPI003AF5BE1E